MKAACSEFLQRQLDPSNCLGIRLFAEKHSCESLKRAAEDYTYKFFEEVIKHDEFAGLVVKDVECLIRSDNIQVITCCSYAKYLNNSKAKGERVIAFLVSIIDDLN